MANPRAEAMKRLREEEELRKLAAKQAGVSEQNNNNLFRDSKLFGNWFDPKNYTETSFNDSNIFGDFFDKSNYGNSTGEMGFKPNYNLFIDDPASNEKRLAKEVGKQQQLINNAPFYGSSVLAKRRAGKEVDSQLDAIERARLEKTPEFAVAQGRENEVNAEKARVAGLLADQNRMQQGQTSEGPSLFGNWFDKDNYTGMYDNVTGAVKDAIPLAKELLDFSTAGQDPEANQTTMAQIQAGMDADSGLTTQENYELASGVDRAPAQMTAASISESIAETFELAETAVDAEASGTTIDLEFVVGKEKADILSEWAKSSVIGDTFKSWGSMAMDKLGFAGDDEELTEVEVDNIIKVTKELSPEQTDTSKVDGLLKDTGGATHTMPDGTVMPGATHTVDAGAGVGTNVFNAGDTTSSNTTNTKPSASLMNTTASSDSLEGFTMDRLKNPLSADNKAWWLGGGGGVPGNNRAKEFFDTLAYIGTPMKYRPAKTPSQQGMENRIAQQNNVMDYNSSMASANSSTSPTFAALRASLPSPKEIRDAITPSMTLDFDEGWRMSGDDQLQLDSNIESMIDAVSLKMIEMARGGKSTSIKAEYANVVREARAAQKLKEEEERLAKERLAAENKSNNISSEKKWWDFSSK